MSSSTFSTRAVLVFAKPSLNTFVTASVFEAILSFSFLKNSCKLWHPRLYCFLFITIHNLFDVEYASTVYIEIKVGLLNNHFQWSLKSSAFSSKKIER